jgi:hypothetical protein
MSKFIFILGFFVLTILVYFVIVPIIAWLVKIAIAIAIAFGILCILVIYYYIKKSRQK